MRRYFTLILLLIIAAVTAQAQYTRHIVQFTDKKGTQGTIANPSAYLSAKAIARRTNQNIAIDSTDLPISKAYLDSIASVPNVTILNRSKWLNQILIRTSDAAALVKINSFPFVKSRTGVAPRININGREVQSKKLDEGNEIELTSSTSRVQGTEDIQLDYGSTANQIKIHKGEYLHNLGFTGGAITIAILDAGFLAYKTNPALDSVRLQGRILGEWDYVMNEASVNEDNSHGANCFTIIASNRPGIIVGSSPHSKFWLLRTEDAGSEYIVEEQNWAAGAEFADSLGVEMISSSLGYYDFDDPAFDHSYAQRDGNTSIVTRAADLAAHKGIMVMNSAGNSGALTNDNKFVACPADGDSVVTVGAVTTAGVIASFSSWGPNGAGKLKPNIVSVGQNTVYASTAGNAVAGNGTSYSNPNIAGLIACFWQAFPEFNNMQLLDLVQRSADRFANPDMRYGYGIPDFRKAFLLALQQRASSNFQFNPNACTTTINWTSKDQKGMQYLVQRILPNETDFMTIAIFTSAADSFKTRSYSHTDNVASAKTLMQYRVLQVLSDTTITIATASVDPGDCASRNTQLDIAINPNPVRSNMLRMTVTTTEPFNAGIVVSNMKGQVVKNITRNIPLGPSIQQFGLHNLAAGVYVVRVFKGNEVVFTGQIIK
jgi:subtilisin family serine protease